MRDAKHLIIVAEDNGGDTFLIREALREQKFPFAIEAVEDGESMLSLINDLNSDEKKQCPDLIVLDLNLPKRSGEEVFTHLRNSQRCAETPVIVITSSDSPQDRERATKLRPSAYFRKPSNLDSFMEIGTLIRQVLDPHYRKEPPNGDRSQESKF
ncbi:MAG TPA: response regulator [Bryobacteraceae bacterium]|nr:response regulator [Bryobacteraceae bacterium]